MFVRPFKTKRTAKKWADELCSPLRPQVLPSSIEERILLYEQVVQAEEKHLPFRLVREKFLNFRLKKAWIKCHAEVIPSYVLFYSTSKKETFKAQVECIHQGVGFLSKEEGQLIDLEAFNRLAGTYYNNVKELLHNPPTVDCEIEVRKKLFPKSTLGLSPLFVVDSVQLASYEIFLQSHTYSDVRENLVFIG